MYPEFVILGDRSSRDTFAPAVHWLHVVTPVVANQGGGKRWLDALDGNAQTAR